MITFTMAAMLQASVLAAEPLSYDEAYKEAESGKPLVMLIGADWCPACQTMKNSSLPKVEQDGVLQEVAFTVVNTDTQREIAKEAMEGGSIPQLVMYHKTETGWQRQRLNGPQSPSAIVSFLRRGIAAARRVVR